MYSSIAAIKSFLIRKLTKIVHRRLQDSPPAFHRFVINASPDTGHTLYHFGTNKFLMKHFLHFRRSWGRLRVNTGKCTADGDGSDSRSQTALCKECCLGVFFCFDGAEKQKKGCYNFTVPCKRLLFLVFVSY